MVGNNLKVHTSLKYENYDFVVWNEMKWTITIHRKIEQELGKLHASDGLYQKARHYAKHL